MYESYFGLTERPFSIAPDPHYLYMSMRHKEAMAHLSYGLSQGGCFIVLTGEVGTGKTTLCRNLLTDLPNNVDVALILNANLNEAELLQTVCDELKISYSDDLSQKQLLDLINHYLLKTFSENRHTVLIIDEAQLLKRDVLEQIRLLTNLETTKSKLLQIILIGQPELYGLLSRNDLRQLAQRVTARYHLGSLQRNEIEEYVNYRLGVAGCKQPLFTRQALNKMHDLTGGIPRKINVLADHSLLATYSQTRAVVDSKIVTKAAKEVFIVSKPEKNKRPQAGGHFTKWAAVLAAVLVANIAAWYYFAGQSSQGVSGNNVVIDANPRPAVTNRVEGESVINGTQAVESVVQFDDLVQEITTNEAEELSERQEREAVVASIQPELEAIDALTTQGISPGTSVVSETFLSVDPKNDTIISREGSAQAVAQPHQDLSQITNTSFGRVLESSADLTGRISAFRRLALEWNTQLPNKILKPVCDAASEQGLSCLSFKKWPDLEAFNRPAILVVEHQGKAHRVVIKSITGNVADVLIANSVHKVALPELQQRWTGAGVILWRSESPSGPFLEIGYNNVDVLAARRKLNAALKIAQLPKLASLDSTVFDLDMMQKTAALQHAYGLVDDGQIGSETHLLLNELADSELTPVLSKRASQPVL